MIEDKEKAAKDQKKREIQNKIDNARKARNDIERKVCTRHTGIYYLDL